MPASVTTAPVTETSHMTHEDLIRPKGMPIWASGWWTGDPLTGRRLHKVAQHARTAYESLCFFCACSLDFERSLTAFCSSREP
jgi:hypothetical protein